MKKLVKVKAKDNIEYSFTKGKEYDVVSIDEDFLFDVINDQGHTHGITFQGSYINNFELIYEIEFETAYQYSGLTDREHKIMDNIILAYNEFIKLESQHPSEIKDFVNAIHTLQSIMAMRVVRREHGDYWLIYNN